MIIYLFKFWVIGFTDELIIFILYQKLKLIEYYCSKNLFKYRKCFPYIKMTKIKMLELIF